MHGYGLLRSAAPVVRSSTNLAGHTSLVQLESRRNVTLLTTKHISQIEGVCALLTDVLQMLFESRGRSWTIPPNTRHANRAHPFKLHHSRLRFFLSPQVVREDMVQQT